jgi:HrpA-like RNA helicase
MPLPTLLSPNKIKILPHHSEYEINKIKTIPAVDYIMEWFTKRIPSRKGGIPIIRATTVNDKIMILRSGTGSGKSNTLGPEFYKRYYEATKRNIAVTQPRVLTALQIPEDIIKFYPEMIMGETIGYQTGDYVYKPKKGVIFMTIGLLSQQLKVMTDEEFMEKYAFIVLDECHDRSLGMDLTLSLFKKFIYRNFKNLNCPFLILTSATFDVEKYADYFGVDHKNIIDVEGLNYPIEINYPEVPVANFIQYSVKQALDIHTKNVDDYAANNRFTDILIFVSGMSPMKKIKDELDKANNTMDDNHFVVIGLTGATFGMGDIAYQNIFKPLTSIGVILADKRIVTPKRRIIISTDVAETGVTIDTLKYLIDTGYVNTALFNPIQGSSAMMVKSVTQASALQRKGRVGRRAAGVYYPMFTESIFNNMQTDKFPELILADISDVMLGLIVKSVHPLWDGVISDKIEVTGSFDVSEIDMLDYPAIDSIEYAIDKLFVLGMIYSDYKPTAMGLATTRVTKIPIEITRMILAGYQQGANILDLITIGAFMYAEKRDYIDTRSKVKYNYETTFKKNTSELEYYNKFFVADDFIEPVFIWEDFMDQIGIMKKKLSISHVKNWCIEHGLIYDGLLRIIETRDSIIEAFIQSIGIDPFYNGAGIPKHQYSLIKFFQNNVYLGLGEIRKLKRCIYEGFRLKMATWDKEKNTYVLDVCHQKIKISSDVIKPVPAHETIYQTRPKKIIVRDISLKQSKFNPMYQYECDRVSVMDGYVDVDETFSVS